MTGMLLFVFVLSIIIAVVIDIVSYGLMPATQKRGYYPNLSLWGVGFLIGLCINFICMLGTVISEVKTAFTTPPTTSYALTQNIIFIIVPALLLVVTIWAIAKVCHKE